MIVPVAFDWDRDGDIDLIVGDEDGRVALVENTGAVGRRSHAAIPARRATFSKRPTTSSAARWPRRSGSIGTATATRTSSPATRPATSSSSKTRAVQASRSRVGRAPERLEADGAVFRVMAGPNGSVQGPAEAKWGYTTCSVADWDGDGVLDIVFNSIWGRVEWLRNEGSRTEPRLSASRPIEVEWPGATPKPAWTWWTPQAKELVTQWRTTPVVFDFNADGLADLAMLDSEGYLAFFERSRKQGQLVLLPPRRAFLDDSGRPLRLNPRRAGASGRRKLCVVDWNGDGRFDLLLNSTNADLLRQIDASDGCWRFQPAGPLARQNIEGHDVSPTIVDFDGDGTADFLGGAEDGHFYLLSHPRASKP